MTHRYSQGHMIYSPYYFAAIVLYGSSLCDVENEWNKGEHNTYVFLESFETEKNHNFSLIFCLHH